VQIWVKMRYHNCVRGHDRHDDDGHNDEMEELETIITCVTGDARHRRTIYEEDQDS